MIAYITSQFSVVKIPLKDGELSALHILVQLRSLGRQTPEAAARSPVSVRSHDQLAFSMKVGPFLEDKEEIFDFLVGQRGRSLVLQLLVIGLGLEELLGVGNGVKKEREVARKHVRDKPGDGFGSKDNLRSQARCEKETGQDKIDVELKARVVKNKVNTALLLALVTSLFEGRVSLGKVVDQNVLLGGLTGLASLELLDILVGEVGEQRKVSGITPEADLKHFCKEQLLGLFVVGGVLVGANLGNKLLVSSGQLDDSVTRGAEGVHLLARKDVVVLPVLGKAEKCADASVERKLAPRRLCSLHVRAFHLPVHIAFREQPRNVQPRRVA